MATWTGGTIITGMLDAEGVERAFGIIDGTDDGLYPSLAQDERVSRPDELRPALQTFKAMHEELAG